MINTLVLTLALLGADDFSSISANDVALVCNSYGCGSCRTGSCGVGGCGPGGCAPGYSRPVYSSSSYYSQPVAVAPALKLTIADVPTNQERSRFYVKARVNGNMYNIPIINGIAPNIVARNANDLVLSYSTGVQFNTSMFGNLNYLDYSTSAQRAETASALKTFDNTNVTTSKQPVASALKHPDAMPKETVAPLPSSRPSDDRIDSLLRSAAPGPKAPSKTINEDTLDDFLKRPSSIGDTDRVFPRY